MKKNRILAFTIIIITACQSEFQNNSDASEIIIPEHVNQLENLTIYSPDVQPQDTVILTRKTKFESNDDVFMSGYISTFSVDDLGRVFIVSSVPGNLGVYVFNPDGSYLTTIGSFGRGPGEFEAIGSIDIMDSQILIFDPRLQKFTIFSLDTFEILHEGSIRLNEAILDEELTAVARGSSLFFTDNNSMILEVHMSSLSEQSDDSRMFYYSLLEDGTVKPGSLIEAERHTRYFLPEREGFALPVTMPFNRSSLMSVSSNGYFFTAWTEDFLIKKYDHSGNYVRSFYYPVAKSSFSLSQIEIADHEMRILRDREIPDTWPALHTMELDDEEQLWVAVITDRETEYEWFVLDTNGELIAGFSMQGKRSQRVVVSKPLITIKNGYFYTHEQNISEGIDRIVKYKINFKQR